MKLSRREGQSRSGAYAALVVLLGFAGALALPAHRATAARSQPGQGGVARRLPPPGPIETITGHRLTTPGRMISEEWSATALPAGSVPARRASTRRRPSRDARLNSAVHPLFTPPTPTLTVGPFDGPDETVQGFIPPDDSMAAGPDHVVVTVNTVMQVYTKTGAPAGGLQILDTAAGHFFGDFGLTSTETSDPRIAYDEVNDRWIVTILEFEMTAPTHSNILIGASQTGDPTGAWNKFVFDNGSVHPDDPTVGTLGDQPSLGLSANFLYTSADEFPFAGGGATQESLRIFALADLYGGVPNPPLEFGPLTDAAGFQYFAMRPAITHGSSDLEFVVSADPRPLLFGTQGTYMTVMAIDANPAPGQPPTMTKRLVSVPAFNNPPNAVQPGTGTPIATNDSRMDNADWRNGSLWCAQTVASANGTAAVARWYQLTANSITQLALAQTGTESGAGNAYFPSVCQNSNGQALMGFTTSSSTQFPSAAFTVRSPMDPIDTMNSFTIYQAGTGPYVDAALRWGDYSGVWPDPDGSTIWTVQEYSKSPNLATPVWGTSVTAASVPSFSISGTINDVTSGSPVPLPGIKVQLTANDSTNFSVQSTAAVPIPASATLFRFSPVQVPDSGILSALTITANVTNPNPSRLVFELQLPNGTLIPLTNNYPNLTISGTALANLLAQSPQVHGRWLLFVRDPVTGTTPFRGTLNFWTLNLTYNRTLGQPAVTDASGNYVFTGLSPTTYTVTPVSPAFNFTPPSADVTITNADVTGVDFDATALPATLLGLTIVPAHVRSGVSATGTVSLTGPVSTDTLVSLSSDNAAVMVPGSVTILAGQTSASFTINTDTVDTSTTGTVTATGPGGDQATATLTVQPAGLVSFTISPNSVDSGGTVNGTVTLSGGAPAGGALITLRSSSSIVQVPPSETLTQGQTSITFPITTTRITGAAVVRVTATFNGSSQTATLTLFGPLLGNIIPRPATLRGGTFGFLRVNLVRPAPASGVTVNLSSGDPSVVTLSQNTVVFNQGEKVKQVSISAARVTLSTRVTLTATQGGITRQTVVTVNPP